MADTKDLEQDYAGAKFGQGLGFGEKPALVIVDFVMAYLDKSSPLYAGVEETLESCKRVLAAAREAGIPVIFTNVEYDPEGINGGIFFRKLGALKVFLKGSPLGAFPEGLTPQAGELVVTKQYPSAFFGTSLAPTLTSQGIDTVIVTGLTTSGCVRATALDAMQYGFIPIVVREAVGDRDPRPQEANLFDLQAKYADVLNESEVTGWLASRTEARSVA